MKPNLCGRADLIRALVGPDPALTAALAALLGYQETLEIPRVKILHSAELDNGPVWQVMQLDSAEAVLEEALAIRSDWAAPHAAIGALRAQLGRSEDAVRSFERALEIDSSSPLPYRVLGDQYQSVGRFDAAVLAYKQALRE